MSEIKTHGGARKGAGRKKTSESTKPMRIPESLQDTVQTMIDIRKSATASIVKQIILPKVGDELELPLVSSKVSAGFPSPADDYVEGMLDLHQLLITHPSATFYVRVTGDSMIGAGIYSGDLLVVDKSLTAKPQNIVIGIVEGELTVKRLVRMNGQYYLTPENPDYKAIACTESVEIWGVVTSVIRQL